jgi:nucleotide-binding universal stress UspA family protein
MSQPKHILLTTDLSQTSHRAFAPVVQLAQALGARITLLSVLEDQVYFTGAGPSGGVPMGMAMESAAVAQAARDHLNELRQSMPEGIEVDVAAEIGNDVPKTIVDYANGHGVDLIAMATHGRSVVRRLVLGSIAESVLRHAKVPVLMFPPTE